MYDVIGWIMFVMMLVFFVNCFGSRYDENW